MKPLLLIGLFAFSFHLLTAQTHQWTWVKGDSAINKYGVYGIRGSSSPGGKPGARNRCNSWTDAAGNLWLFGGAGCAVNNSGYLNDLWKYNPATNEWNWINGDSITNMKSSYGTLGIASSTNKPGARKNSVTWRDGANNLWLFGGYGYNTSGSPGILNDLWKYDITTNQWTWIKGDTILNASGLYGTQGISSITKKPGARHLSSGWADTQGNLWLFGGFGYDEAGLSGDLSDLWKYNIASNKWTWVKGDSLRNKKGTYGTRGVSSNNSKPGARAGSVIWTDLSGAFWMFGGYGYDTLNPGYLSDLWKYNTATNQWTWVNGDNIINVRPTYGNKEIPAINNNPGARDYSIGSMDAQGNLWLFGGFGYPANGFGSLNDLWKYNTASNEWTWIKGDVNDNAIASYGPYGYPSSLSKPGSRQQGVSWTDAQGKLWIFGGQGYTATTSGYLNDLWKYDAENMLPVHLISFTGKLKNEKTNLEWLVENEQNFDHYEIEKTNSVNGSGNIFNKTGSVAATNKSHYSFTDNLPFTVQSNDRSALAGHSYYRLKMVDKDGKFIYSNVIEIKMPSYNGFTIYPNPATTGFQLSPGKIISGKVTVEIISTSGKIVFKKLYESSANIFIATDNISPGTYLVKLHSENEEFMQTLIVVNK